MNIVYKQKTLEHFGFKPFHNKSACSCGNELLVLKRLESHNKLLCNNCGRTWIKINGE